LRTLFIYCIVKNAHGLSFLSDVIVKIISNADYEQDHDGPKQDLDSKVELALFFDGLIRHMAIQEFLGRRRCFFVNGAFVLEIGRIDGIVNGWAIDLIVS
jgi:hypothetical protein